MERLNAGDNLYTVYRLSRLSTPDRPSNTQQVAARFSQIARRGWRILHLRLGGHRPQCLEIAWDNVSLGLTLSPTIPTASNGDKTDTLSVLSLLILSPTEPTAPNHLIRWMSPAAGEATCTNNLALETCQIQVQSC